MVSVIIWKYCIRHFPKKEFNYIYIVFIIVTVIDLSLLTFFKTAWGKPKFENFKEDIMMISNKGETILKVMWCTHQLIQFVVRFMVQNVVFESNHSW